MTAPNAHRQNFDRLTRTEQAAAIRRLAAQGFSDYGCAAASGLSVEMVRAILAAVPDTADGTKQPFENFTEGSSATDNGDEQPVTDNGLLGRCEVCDD